MLLPMLASAQTKVEIDGIWYNLVSKAKQAEVTSGDTKYSGSITIPATVTHENVQYSVTSIGNSAFSGCTGLESITLPEGVTSIGYSAFFNCSSLTSITLPENVTNIENEAFKGCIRLRTIINYSDLNIDNSWDNGYIGYYAYKIIDVDEFIGDYAFKTIDGMHYLNSYIGNDTELTLPNNYQDEIYKIGERAFSGCSSLTTITIPEGVRSIGKQAFASCTSLTAITLPETIISIGEQAFYGCTGLESITFPEGVTSIGEHAFQYCSSLTAVHISSIKSWCNISFADYWANPLDYAKNLYLNGVLVTDLTIPEEVILIKDWAFYGCRSLTAINIPESVTSIGEYAFSGCSSLTSITLLDGVTSIGDWAFSGCNSLTTIVLPKKMKNIGSKAFANCGELLDVYCYAESLPSTKADIFDGSYPEYITLHVPASALDAYRTNAPWSSFGTIKSLTNELVTEITLSQQIETMTEGESLTLTATVAPTYATDRSITWSSSNTNIVCVDANGTVTALSPGTAVITATANDGSEVSASCEITVEATRTSIAIIDPHTEDNFIQNQAEENISITYTRNLPNTKWNALFVPFEIPVSTLEADYEVAYINDIHSFDNNEDGEIDEMKMEVIKIKSGTLYANHPYLIRAKSEEVKEMTLVVENATLFSTAEEYRTNITCSSAYTNFEVIGTYERKSAEELEGCYAINTNGQWSPLSAGTALNPFRLYLTITDRKGNPVKVSNTARAISIHTRGENTTSIDDEEMIMKYDYSETYDLMGRRVTEPQRGVVYIENGKKVVY